MTASAALVTQAVGESFLAYWNEHCKQNWSRYAERHGYDLHVITERIDRSDRAAARSVSWQKCLLLAQPVLQQYRQLVLVDSDVAINFQSAPSIIETVPEEMVGGVISGSYLLHDLKSVFLERACSQKYDFCPDLRHWNDHQRQFYERYGLKGDFDEIIQAGVLVVSPRHHRELFENVYYRNYPGADRSFEQVPLSHAVMQTGLLYRLNSRFNTVFYERMLVHYPYLCNKQLNHFDMLARIAVFVEWSNSFFLHFAYDRDFARFLPKADALGC